MRFGFLFSGRFWVAIWIVILFIGLTPLPPAAELVIVVAFVAHAVWFVQHRLRAIAFRRALARAEKAEEEEFRRLRRRRPPHGYGTVQALVYPGPTDPTYHGASVDSSVDRVGSRT